MESSSCIASPKMNSDRAFVSNSCGLSIEIRNKQGHLQSAFDSSASDFGLPITTSLEVIQNVPTLRSPCVPVDSFEIVPAATGNGNMTSQMVLM
ncbi:hypothetical protein Tco_0184312 [Tanacetum coccineum]